MVVVQSMLKLVVGLFSKNQEGLKRWEKSFFFSYFHTQERALKRIELYKMIRISGPYFLLLFLLRWKVATVGYQPLRSLCKRYFHSSDVFQVTITAVSTNSGSRDDSSTAFIAHCEEKLKHLLPVRLQLYFS